MVNKIYSSDENCHKTLIYQLFMIDTLDCGRIEKMFTWIGDETEDVFSKALRQLVDEVTELTGQTVTEDMYEYYEHKYDKGEMIKIKGYKFEILCHIPEYKEKY